MDLTPPLLTRRLGQRRSCSCQGGEAEPGGGEGVHRRRAPPLPGGELGAALPAGRAWSLYCTLHLQVPNSVTCTALWEPAVVPSYLHRQVQNPLIFYKNILENSIAKALKVHDRPTVLVQCVAQLCNYCPKNMQNRFCKVHWNLKTLGWKNNFENIVICCSGYCHNVIHHRLHNMFVPQAQHISLNTKEFSSFLFWPRLSSLRT